MAESKFLVVDNIRTHYLEAGSGRPFVLLHSGDFGACGEFSWRYQIDLLADRYRVIAPDWLGFGKTDKLFDFVDSRGRRQDHMARFLRALDLGQAAFMGSSMGGSDLVRNVANRTGRFDVAAMVLSSGGGFAPDTEARRLANRYDAQPESMRAIIRAVMHDPKWSADERFVAERYQASIQPGVWEYMAAQGFHSPVAQASGHFGQADKTPYEDIDIPTLIVAGDSDPLRNPGYALELQSRIPGSKALVYEQTGHFPHIEQAGRFNADLLAFLEESYPA